MMFKAFYIGFIIAVVTALCVFAAHAQEQPPRLLCLSVACSWKDADGGVDGLMPNCPSGFTPTRYNSQFNEGQMIACACCHAETVVRVQAAAPDAGVAPDAGTKEEKKK